MGCFLGCFGGKDQKRRNKRTNRASPQRQNSRVPNVQQEITIGAEHSLANTCATKSDLELRNEIEGVEELSPSPKRKVTFSSDVTTYEHVSVHESIDSQPDATNIGKEETEELKAMSHSNSTSVDDNSVASSVGSYPPNHRYHNARDSDDETEEYSDDSDLDDDFDEYDDEDDYGEDNDVKICDKEGLFESVFTGSAESRTGDRSSARIILDEVESPVVDEGVEAYQSKTNDKGRSDYVNSVLNPIENITQWKAAKSKRGNMLKPNVSLEEAAPPRIAFSSEPTFEDTMLFGNRKYEKLNKNTKQEIAVDASLSNWLPPQVVRLAKNDFSGLEADKSVQTMSGGCTPPRSFEDRPILGALTMEELKQISASASPRKSPSRSPDEMPIIGTVGTYWNHLSAAKHANSSSSFKGGIPNTTSKYREDKRVNWHSTPFEKRLDRALNQGAAEA